MSNERYRCVCHSCDESKFVDERDAAQEFFNEHADRGCEVVLRSIAAHRRLAESEPVPPESETNDSSSEAE